MTPTPMPPPGPDGAIPRVGERLPLLPTQGRRLRKMLREATREEFSNKELDTVCYLLRRAYGEGFAEGLKTRGD